MTGLSTVWALSSASPPGNHVLAPGAVVLGRSSQCDVVIKDPSVSRRHAVVCVDGDRVTVRDLGSTNGTFLEDERVSESRIMPGQRLRFGKVSFLLTKVTDTADLDLEAETDRAGGSPADGREAVSPAQRDVLNLLRKGLGEKQIAYQLGLSTHTVHNHVKAIYRILDVHSRSELLLRLLRPE